MGTGKGYIYIVGECGRDILSRTSWAAALLDIVKGFVYPGDGVECLGDGIKGE